MSSRNDFLAMAFDNSPRRQEGGARNQDVVKRAIELGMDPYKDEKLFWIAEQSLKAKIPDGWAEYIDDNGQTYYYNEELDDSSWEHPSTTHYKGIYARCKSQLQSTPERNYKSPRGGAIGNQGWVEQLPPPGGYSAPPPVPQYSNDVVNEMNFWKQKCEEMESQSRALAEENDFMKNGLVECEDKLRSVTSDVCQFLIKHDLPCRVPSGTDGGIVAAIANSEVASRACIDAIEIAFREQKSCERKASDAETIASQWEQRESDLKADYNSMERKLLATIDKKKSAMFAMEDDLSRLQSDIDRLREERNELRDILDEQRAGDASFNIVTKKLDAEYAKNRDLTRELTLAKDEIIAVEITVQELTKDKSDAVKRMKDALVQLDDEKIRASELSSENSALELTLLAAQKALRSAEEEKEGRRVSAQSEEALLVERSRVRALETELEQKTHELSVAQTKISGLQERLEDLKSTEHLLSSKLDANSDRYIALQDRIDELVEKLSKADSASQHLQRHNEQLKSQLADALNASNRTKNATDREKSRLEVLTAEKAILEETIERLEEDGRGSSERYMSLQALFDKCVSDLEDSQSRVATLKKEVEDARGFKDDLREEKKQRSALEGELEKKYHELAVAQTKILGLQERIEDQKSTEQLLSSKFSSLTRSLEDIRMSQEVSKENEAMKASADIKVFELEAQRLSDQLSNERRRMADMEQNLAAAEKRADEYAARQASQAAEFLSQEKSLQSKVEKKKNIIQELAEQKRELEKNVAELYNELNTSLTENETLRRQKTEAESYHAKVDSAELAKVVAKLELERERSAALEREIALLKSGSSTIDEELRELRSENKELKRKARDVKSSVSGVQEELNRERDICLALTNDYRELEDEVKKLRQRIVKLNDTIVELKGSIMVFCRVRPVGRHEIEDLGVTQEAIDNLVKYPDYNLIDFKQNSFEYDRVFVPDTAQETIFDEVEPFVRSAMGGFRVCIFAYGQTSSGKTHTMEGPEHDRGVNLRALNTILHLSATDDNYVTDVSMSMLEVYNEKIRDLLNVEVDVEGVDNLDVRMGKQGTYVDGLTDWPIKTMEDVLETIGRGASNRRVASNGVNEHSSRSHLVTLIKIDRRHKTSDDGVLGYLYLVDLAGSERIKQTAATGQRLKEAQNINKSLSSLGDVIAALASGQKHIPYRNSKLTFLLQDALRENSKVLMFVNINPTPQYGGESLCSLQFASRCRSVTFGQAKKVVTSGGK